MSPGKFFAHFLSSPGHIGAVVPSSPGLAHLITDAADLPAARTIVEWGPGTGVFTEQILLKKNSAAVFFAVELNPEFAAATQKRCPRARIIHDSATNTRRHLTDLGLAGCDRVVCGLPWAAFPEALQNDLLDALVDTLQPGGMFVTFAYLQGLLLPAGWRFRQKLRSRFPSVTTTRVEWRNLPPAFVYCARK